MCVPPLVNSRCGVAVPQAGRGNLPGLFLIRGFANGRLLCDVGCFASDLVGVVMILRRVVCCWAFLVFGVAAVWPLSLRATCADVTARLNSNSCNGEDAGQGWRFSCTTQQEGRFTAIYQTGVQSGGGTSGPRRMAQYECNSCEIAPDVTGWLDLKTGALAVACNGGCKYYLADGNSTSNGLGDSVASGNWKPTGGQCPVGEDLPPVGGNGDGGVGPRVCASGVCYDPNSDEYCYAESDGLAKTCVSGATARGEGTAPGDTPSGGCASGANSAICAGNPPPLPPRPPESPISDPASEINSSDRFSNSKASSGGGTPVRSSVDVNVYGSGNVATTSGQGPGDRGPASASSSGGAPGGGGDDEEGRGSMSGGGTCGSPPVCTGDAPTCGVVTQTWLLRCGTSKGDANGDGQPDWTEVGEGDGSGYEVTDTPVDAVFKSEVVDGSKIDQTSWAGNTCPQLPTVEVFGRPWSMDQGYFCDWLAMLRPIFLLVAGFVAVRITASGGKA